MDAIAELLEREKRRAGRAARGEHERSMEKLRAAGMVV